MGDKKKTPESETAESLETKMPPAANKPQNLKQAMEMLRAAEERYRKTVQNRVPNRGLNGKTGERQKAAAKYHKDCRRALADKRWARACVEALKHNRAAPDPGDLVETKILTEG